MVYFKACPRCHGDMHVSQDIYGNYRECLQCGYIVEIKDTRRTERSWILAVAKSKPRRGRRRKAA